MLRFSGKPTGALPLPQELPAGIPENPRVMRLIDLDSVSHGLTHDGSSSRASNHDVQLFLDIVQATAHALDPQSQVRCASSSATAAYHLDVLTSSGGNQWSIRRGLDGADQVLLEEMNYLISTRVTATRPGRKGPVGRKSPARHADLLILVGKDHIYAPSVGQLRLKGIPTWLIEPGGRAARSLRRRSWAVSLVGPDVSDPTTWGPVPLPYPFPLKKES